LGEAAGPYLFRIVLRGGRIEQQVREFDANEAGPIQFILPAFGEVLIRLTGAPGGLLPNLVTIDDTANRFGRPPTSEAEAGGFLFERVAIGQRFRVGGSIDAPGQRSRGSAALTFGEIAGPTIVGERVEHTLHYQHPPGFYGQFILPEGVDPQVLVSDRSRSTGSAMIVVEPEGPRNIGVQAARFSVYPDGSFWISSGLLGPPNTPDVTVKGIEYVFVGSKGSTQEEQRKAESAYVLWAAAPAHLPSYESVVDLGEVTLKFGKDLLHLTVLNEDGDPVPMARVSVQARVERDIKRGPGSHSQHFGNSFATDSKGQVLVVHRDWFHGFELQRYHDVAQAASAMESIRVTVAHPDYLEQSQVIALDRSRLTITLQGSGKVHGSVLHFPGLQTVNVAVVTPGEAYDERKLPAGLFTGQADFRGQPAPERDEFKLSSVPEGIWDVVFTVLLGGRSELFRVPGVQVTANEVNEDPRLQDVDLSNHVDLIRLAFRNQDGKPLTFTDRAEFAPTVTMVYKRGSVSGPPLWLDDEVVLAVPTRGRLNLGVFAEGWMSQNLNDVAMGHHVVTMRRPVHIVLRMQNWDRLPAGAKVSFTQDLRFGMRSGKNADYLAGPEVEIELNGVGKLVFNWKAELDGVMRHVATSEHDVSDADAIDGAVLDIAIPEKVFEVLNPQ
jgi:hypothetical protein